ncbi:GtrA family protein [Dongia sp.]|uniref:GtrA family protein n=1 Tax=Dongia sp. TaxID=1977262 RepID=UPI0035B49F04
MTLLGWMRRQFVNRQFGLFLLVGGTAAMANWLARLWLAAYFSFAAAVAVAYVAGVIVAFILNCIFVFPNSVRSLGHRLSFFVGTNALMFPVVWTVSTILEAIVFPFIGIVRHADEIAHACGLVAPVLLSFLIHKFFTFGGRKPTEPKETMRR